MHSAIQMRQASLHLGGPFEVWCHEHTFTSNTSVTGIAELAAAIGSHSPGGRPGGYPGKYQMRFTAAIDYTRDTGDPARLQLLVGRVKRSARLTIEARTSPPKNRHTAGSRS